MGGYWNVCCGRLWPDVERDAPARRWRLVDIDILIDRGQSDCKRHGIAVLERGIRKCDRRGSRRRVYLQDPSARARRGASVEVRVGGTRIVGRLNSIAALVYRDAQRVGG